MWIFDKKYKLWYCSDKKCKKTNETVETKILSEKELFKLFNKCQKCWEDSFSIKHNNTEKQTQIKITRWNISTEIHNK